MKQGILIGAALLGVGGGAWSRPAWSGASERPGDPPGPPGEPPATFAAGLATITTPDLERHAAALAAPELEGRDSPSAGLELAARYIEGELAAAGLEPLGGDLRYRLPFAQRAAAPVAGSCALVLEGAEGERAFTLGADFVPVAYCGGAAEGELVFAGFGIRASDEHYDDLRGRGLEGALAVIVEGEPRHVRRFEGEELSEHATLWTKLAVLAKEHVAGVLVVRRPPPYEKGGAQGGSAPAGLAFRHDFATWATEAMTPVPGGLSAELVPAAEITPECARALLGFDVLAEAAELDRTARASGLRPTGRRARLAVATEVQELRVDNVVGLVRGSDPSRAGEIVVIGAHYDHVGVDDRGRVGLGADDNASGTAALLELAQRPGRGAAGALGGLRGLRGRGGRAARLGGVLRAASVAHGRGRGGGAAGHRDRDAQHGHDRAREARRGRRDRHRAESRPGQGPGACPAPRAERRQPAWKRAAGAELWERSDHFSFHQVGVPVLFFFEGLPISDNPDYHTWRDTLEQLDLDKIARTTRLVFNTAWLLANDADKPAPPRH